MPKFVYEGADARGEPRRGELEAADLPEASARVRSEGVEPHEMTRMDSTPDPPALGDVDAFVFFNRSLAEMARIGFPLPEAVREISSGMRRDRFRAGLERVEAALREGKSLHEAVGLAADFPPYYRAMLEAGEAAGNLPRVLLAVARGAEAARRARRALVNALSYPALLLVFGGALVAGFFLLFFPLYGDMYRQFNLEPSAAYRAAATILSSAVYPPAILGGIVLLLLFLWYWMAKTVPGERFLFRVPFLGGIVRRLCMARLIGTLSVLLRARAPLAEALPVALGAAGSRQLRAEAERWNLAAGEGAGLTEVLRRSGAVPREVAGYLALAERTGRLPEGAGEMADLLTEQAVAECEALFLFLLPAALIAIGSTMTLLFVSMALPYFRFLEQMGR